MNEGLTIEQIEYILNQAALQVQVAMLLSISTIIVLLMVLAFAFAWRKTGMLFAVAWGVVTTMVPNGHSQILGPAVALIALGSLTALLMGAKKGS